MRIQLIAVAALGVALVLLAPVMLLGGALPTSPAGATLADLPAQYVPIYQAAADAYSVPWLLLAAIQERETAFSTLDAAGVRDGANGCGAAGPMQFGIVGLAPYKATASDCGAMTGTGAGDTWRRYQQAFARLPAAVRALPHRLDRGDLPACRPVPSDQGCVYDDIDAIAAAAAYLHDLGAGPELDDAAWRAAKAYNGGAQYADAVLARARAWQAQLADDLASVDPATSAVPGARARLDSDGLAHPPADAPTAVAGAIQAANEISDRPYVLRHWPTHIDNPSYDCSSATSHVLWGAGRFGTSPWVSGDLERYGEPGPGRWITIYANAEHAFVVVAGLRFDTARYDTGPNQGQSGPRWRLGPRPTANIVVRHPAGL